jgi:hypothetical protein
VDTQSDADAAMRARCRWTMGALAGEPTAPALLDHLVMGHGREPAAIH